MSNLDSFYIRRVESRKRGNMELYEQTLVEVFGKTITWQEFKDAPREKQMLVCVALEKHVKLKESPIDPQKLARAIQNSRSGIGGSALTEFSCKFCNKTEVWENTAVPHICETCATDMAKNIAMHFTNILKEEIS